MVFLSFFFPFIFSQISHSCCCFLSPVGASALLWPLLSQRSKPRHLTAASLPVPPLLWYLPLAALQPQLARNHDTALFVQQLLLLFVWLSPGTLGSTYIVAQPGNSCGDWWVADVWNPAAGAGRNIQQSSAASSTAMPECRDLATVMTQKPKQSCQQGGQDLILSS